MFYVLVKFRDQSVPVLFGTSHTSHASRLAAMTGVEWVSPTITGNGNAIAYETENGGELITTGTSIKIASYAVNSRDDKTQ